MTSIPIRAQVIVEPDERPILDAWLERMGPLLIEFSENRGCGCCVDIHDIVAPAECFAELPASLWSIAGAASSEESA